MKRIDGWAALAAGVVALSLLLAGCARDEAGSPTAASTPAPEATVAANAPPPAATADATAEQFQTVTLNVKGMT